MRNCRSISSLRSTSAASCLAAAWICNAAMQARTAWSSSAVGAPNTAMMPSPVNWLGRTAVAPHRSRRPVEEFGHDLAQPLRPHRRRDVHRMNNIGEQHRHLLVLRRSADLCDRCTALVTELGVQRQLRATRPTRQSRRCQRTATVPNAVHVSIVSPLVSDVRHIAVPSPRRSFETLICRLFETIPSERGLHSSPVLRPPGPNTARARGSFRHGTVGW